MKGLCQQLSAERTLAGTTEPKPAPMPQPPGCGMGPSRHQPAQAPRPSRQHCSRTAAHPVTTAPGPPPIPSPLRLSLRPSRHHCAQVGAQTASTAPRPAPIRPATRPHRRRYRHQPPGPARPTSRLHGEVSDGSRYFVGEASGESPLFRRGGGWWRCERGREDGAVRRWVEVWGGPVARASDKLIR